VDVVISNCVVNLSGDKARVIREAFRVLRPGGRFAVSDVLVQGSIPPVLRRDMEAWAGCIAGAMEEGEIRAALGAAGFEGIEVQVTRVYDAAEIPATAAGAGRFVAAFVRARKPSA
jgi:ubiquinone/menaquinone biosynthesis C-methylase UbiE